MALRATVIEGKGEINPARLNEYKFIMKSLWDEISALADFDKVSFGSSLNRQANKQTRSKQTVHTSSVHPAVAAIRSSLYHSHSDNLLRSGKSVCVSWGVLSPHPLLTRTPHHSEGKKTPLERRRKPPEPQIKTIS